MPTTIQISDYQEAKTADNRREAVRKTSRRLAFEAQADQALASYFARLPGTSLTGSHAEVEAVLASIKPHHRSALAMFHSARVWPEALTKDCGQHTSLVVRLYCSDRPAVGTTRELEANAAAELEAMLTATPPTTDLVDDLEMRAWVHLQRARKAFLTALKVHRSASR
jgi:hypothetical protein